ncbi:MULTISPECIES: flagellar brake protein [unclassified Brenneria]|uniref:flagellar brake protein n=1 Tax=unclassified Brenneria TaxID=2634434 RepID=UPI0015547140|nr:MULTISPECIES: flagellar brake protein [unclassified Brenneria]MBJ7220546.1 flagellar brake protein [Brenneria sp. L3-3C-1]MEE3641790.1 flagellar brake protein [Brenneria sp. L3_3C_1]MEE3649579.1 flagellar brake protein [Brenneria sp. HEZEL_4_2_4]NPC99537.1 flagellar brake protein [Brenneria sp. hezel4-2-4]
MEVVDENLKEQFVKRNKLAICATLRELKKNDTTVMVHHSRGQFISKILDVIPDNNIFIFDLGGVERENSRALYAGALSFVAEPTGAKVEFSAEIARTVDFQGLPAFTASIPEQLYLIQRRTYFRINTPLWPPLLCRGELPDDSRFQFTIRDLSLGGVSLYTDRDTTGLLKEGDIISGVEMDLDEYGFFCVDLQFVGQSTMKDVDNKGEVRITQRLSFKFPMLSAAQERDLQQVIFELERLHNEKKRKFQEL